MRALQQLTTKDIVKETFHNTKHTFRIAFTFKYTGTHICKDTFKHTSTHIHTDLDISSSIYLHTNLNS